MPISRFIAATPITHGGKKLSSLGVAEYPAVLDGLATKQRERAEWNASNRERRYLPFNEAFRNSANCRRVLARRFPNVNRVKLCKYAQITCARCNLRRHWTRAIKFDRPGPLDIFEHRFALISIGCRLRRVRPIALDLHVRTSTPVPPTSL